MIEIIQNCSGYSAVCEYVLVDKEGKQQKQGKYLYIAQLEIAKGYRNKGTIKQLIKQLLEKYDCLKYCYYDHKKRTHFYPRIKYEKLIKEEQNVSTTI